MKVYRIEDDSGNGAYRNSWIIKHNQYSAWSKRVRPGPWDDGIGDFPYHYIFGFANIRDLTRWFTITDRKSYKKNGYHISVYSICQLHVMLGRKQVAFDGKVARKLYELEPYSLEKIDK